MPGTLRACIRGAEADAKVDKWGVMRRSCDDREDPQSVHKAYPRMNRDPSSSWIVELYDHAE